MQIEQREINNYSGNSPGYYEFSSIEDDYEMELDVDLDCQEDIEYLEFETLVQGFSEAQIKTEEERLHFELENLVQRIFEIISKYCYKNDPKNINYVAEEHIYVQNVTNLVKVGKLAGNRNLEFGVKNVLEEYLQDKEKCKEKNESEDNNKIIFDKKDRNDKKDRKDISKE